MPEAMFNFPNNRRLYPDRHTQERAYSYATQAVTLLVEEGIPVRMDTDMSEPYIIYVRDPCTSLDRMCFLIEMGTDGDLVIRFGSIWLGYLKNVEPDEFSIGVIDPSIKKTVNQIVEGVKQRYQAELDYLKKERETARRRDAMAHILLLLVAEFPEYKTLLSKGVNGTLIFNFESDTNGAPEIRAILEALRAAKLELPPCE